MTRFYALSKTVRTRDCVAWGKNNAFEKTGALLFAALLIVCSLAVGCNSDKPKPASSNNQIPVTQNPTPNSMLSSNQPAPVAEPPKPAAKKVVRKRPATVTYVDQTYGVSFDYPRRYGLETGNAANELVASSPLPMNFVVPGGIALAAVELPETAFADTDLSAAFFNVSVNKALSAEQCGDFAVPQPKVVASSDATPASTSAPSTETAPAQSMPTQSTTDQAAAPSATSVATSSAPATSTTTAPASVPGTSNTSKLILGDLELQSAEAVAGEGDRQSDTKYFHLFKNGGCYEFALNVTTLAHETEGGMKHVDRNKVFNRLSAILATVKINPVAAPETASTPAAPATRVAQEAPAQ
ncbi:MAG TPA: hypothetical protein VIW68_05710 [Candidatus Sulfotelmatobacter sp.]